MEKVLNFRDLGGIPAAGGRQIKNGIFYRCASLDEAAPGDVRFLQDLGIRTIVDFRDKFEMQETDVYEQLLPAVYHNLPAGAAAGEAYKVQSRPPVSKLFTLGVPYMLTLYESAPFNNVHYKKFFDLIREDETPILFHCTAGKDRTGMAAALLLTLLGAEQADIMEDYLKTKAVEKALAEKAAAQIHRFFRKMIIRRIEPMFWADEKYLSHCLSAIMDKYGSFAAYFLEEYGITAEETERLREIYTK